jgi:hypothetical protein
MELWKGYVHIFLDNKPSSGTDGQTNPPHDVDGSDLYVWGVNREFIIEGLDMAKE